jgi:hypothetical protein
MDPSNAEIRYKLSAAIESCKKENSVLNLGLKCGAGGPAMAPLAVGGPDRIAGIIIRGNDRISASTLRKSISIFPGDIYDPAKIDRDVTALKNTGYFDDVRAETSTGPTGTMGGRVVIFYVHEKKDAATKPEGARGDLTGLVPSAQGQDIGEAKMVLISPDHSRDAVKVIKITANGEPIHPGRRRIPEIPGKRFAAGDDWIRNLSFVLKNLTSLNIVFVSIDVGFPEAAEYTFNIKLGQVPSPAVAAYFNRPRAVIPTGTGHPLQFGPGQEITISLSVFADAIKEKIEARMPFSNVTKCSIVVDHVYFEDKGLKWGNFGFGYAMPDSASLLGYKRQPWDYFPGDMDQTTGQN